MGTKNDERLLNGLSWLTAVHYQFWLVGCMHSVSLWSFPSLDKKDGQPASSNLKGTGSRSVVAFQTGLTGFSESLTLSFSRLFVTWLVGFETNTETKKEKGKVNYQALKSFNKLFAEGEVNIFRLIHNIFNNIHRAFEE